MLCMLVERICMNIPGAKILYSNTDGNTLRIPKKYKPQYDEICVQWEKDTKLILEHEFYKKMCLSDVNNYIHQYENKPSKWELKLKGRYEIDPDLHKNSSQRIVSIAAKEYFINNVPIKQTIMNHMKKFKSVNPDYSNDIKNYGIFDFFKRVRGKGAGRFITIEYDRKTNYWLEKKMQKTVRYYISNSGVDLIKILPPLESKIDPLDKIKELLPGQTNIFDFIDDCKVEIPRRSFVEAGGWKVTVLNKYEEKENYDIDYSYYIRETNKLINSIKI